MREAQQQVLGAMHAPHRSHLSEITKGKPMVRTRSLMAAALAVGVSVMWSLPAIAQSAPKKFLSAASTNSTLVMAGVGASGSIGGPAGVLLKTAVLGNTTATGYFLKLYNKATAPACGTDLPVQTFPVPPNQTVPIDFGNGAIFPLGLGFCLTGAIGDTDNTAAAAGVAINLGISGR
jgi:hypothetical protein